jgi:hypothetical protein
VGRQVRFVSILQRLAPLATRQVVQRRDEKSSLPERANRTPQTFFARRQLGVTDHRQ